MKLISITEFHDVNIQIPDVSYGHGTDNRYISKVQTIVMIEWEMICKFERYGS